MPYLKENKDEFLNSLRSGRYKPQPVRRVEIPKPDGGVRLLGVPTVMDRMVQQALVPVEPIFSDNSFGFRPNRNAQQAIKRVKEYYEQGYKYAVDIDLAKYFDTVNHDLLISMVREQIKE
nr:reverse transcriptase domain-containing protein [Natranaerobius trueperi]